VTKLSKIWVWDPGSQIRDPEKTYSGSGIPYPGVKKAPDPGSATLVLSEQDGMHRVGGPAASDRVLPRSQVLLPVPHDQRSRDQSHSHWGFLFYILHCNENPIYVFLFWE
jgi:hypothetical protein